MLNFIFMFFCLESNLQKIKGNVRRMYQDIVNSQIEPTDPLSNLIVLRGYHNFSIQVYTAKYLPKNISKGNGMAAWPRSRRVRLAIQRSWVLFLLLGLVEFVLSHPKFKSTATGYLLPVGVFHPVMLYLNYLFLLSI